MSKQSTDPLDVLRELEEEEHEAFKAFQDAQRAKREKALDELVLPLKQERGRLAQEVNEAHIRIAEIDRQVAKLMGRTERPASFKPRRTRVNLEQKLQIGQVLYSLLRQNSGKRYSSRELMTSTDGIQPRQIVSLWNSLNRDKTIAIEGEKSSTRYSV